MPAGPFATGSGRVPEYLAVRTDAAGRSISLADFPPQRRAVLLTGAQGMGKSVELTRAEQLARQAGAIVMRIDASPWSPQAARLPGRPEAQQDAQDADDEPEADPLGR